MSELVWISVPNGERGDNAVLRLLVIPRLTSDSLQAEGLTHWPPAEIASAPLLLDFADTDDTEQVIATIEVASPHLVARAGAWEAFFGAIPVKPVGQMRTRAATPVDVDRTSDTAAAVSSTFDALARARVGVAVMSGSGSELGQILERELISRWAQPRAPTRMAAAASAEASTPPEKPEFHRVLGYLREHPEVLRAIGLLCEVTFAKGSIPDSVANPVVRVRAGASVVGLPPITSPWTQFGPEFRPMSTTGISKGMVALAGEDGTRDERWQIVTVDTDNGAERLRQLGGRLRGAEGMNTAELRLPALRSAGLALVRAGRQQDFDERSTRSASNSRASLDGAILSADDLVLGYRLDVRDRETEDWRSLHARDAKYTVLGLEEILLAEGIEEGHVKPLAAVENESGGLQADEIVATWSGWSLSLPRPAFDRSNPTPPQPVSNTTYRLSWDFDIVEKSLPRLRFGHRYDLRARVADLAGGGLTLEDPLAGRCIIGGTQYLRFDPILPPDVKVPRGGELKYGDSAQHVVIRSDSGVPHEAFITQFPKYASSNTRELHPPRSSLAVAEQHGAIDRIETMEAWTQIIAATGGTGFGEEVAPAVPDYASAGVVVHPLLLPGEAPAAPSDRPWRGDWPGIASKQVELRPLEEGDVPSQAYWEASDQSGGHKLVVCLRPGEQLSLDLSSFPKSDTIDHFAVQPALPDDDARQAVSAGRHPLVSPPSAMTFVHAVRKPVSRPEGDLETERSEGQTFVELLPTPQLLGVHATSTGQVDLTAQWREAEDDPNGEPRTAYVQSLVVRPGDTAFRDGIRHELGDSKHRLVTYVPRAVSRYRSYFDPTEPQEAFWATGAGITVHIPSSARPSAPHVLDTRPAFHWSEEREETGDTTTIMRRRGGRIRVQLEGPWFETGADEKLAVLVTRDGEAQPGTEAYLSQRAADPIWSESASGAWLSTGTVVGTIAPEGVRPGGGAIHVDAVFVDPWSQDGAVYADIDTTLTDSPSSYCPFVRLSLARYQAHSVAGLECSEAVKSEIVQVLPRRELKVVRSPGRVEVTAGSLAARPDLNQVDVILERWTGFGAPPELGVTYLQRQLEYPIDGWVAVECRSQSIQDGRPVTFDLPAYDHLRVRVREYETLPQPDQPSGWPAATSEKELLERVVFADVVPI